MKVLLTRPNSPLAVTPPPVGLGYLSHALKRGRGDKTLILDGRRRRLSAKELVRRGLEFKPDLVGVTAMTFEARPALELIEGFKAEAPGVPVVLGGPHATGFGPDLLSRCQADYLVLGEGERTLVSLADALEGGSGFEAIKGLARREGGEIRYPGPPDPIEEMDSLGVDWEGLDPTAYFSFWTRNAMNTVARSQRRLPLFFSRGCPFACAYCHQIFGRRHRRFDLDKKIEEMLMLRDRWRVREFEIIDDNFNVNLDHAKDALRMIAEQGPETWLAFANGLRADRVDEEFIELMVSARVYRADYAIESASPRIQKLIRKNLDLERAREAVNRTARRGIVTGTYNMMGFPGETLDEMNETIEFALALKNHIASFFQLMPFPGTEIAESNPQLAREVRKLEFGDASALVKNLSAVPDRMLRNLRKQAYRRFYFAPSRMARIMKHAPKNGRLLAAAAAVTRLSLQERVNY